MSGEPWESRLRALVRRELRRLGGGDSSLGAHLYHPRWLVEDLRAAGGCDVRDVVCRTPQCMGAAAREGRALREKRWADATPDERVIRDEVRVVISRGQPMRMEVQHADDE